MLASACNVLLTSSTACLLISTVRCADTDGCSSTQDFSCNVSIGMWRNYQPLSTEHLVDVRLCRSREHNCCLGVTRRQLLNLVIS